MHIRIDIDCSNAAFDDEGFESEVRRVLSEAADMITKESDSSLRLRDINGNLCGTVSFN